MTPASSSSKSRGSKKRSRRRSAGGRSTRSSQRQHLLAEAKEDVRRGGIEDDLDEAGPLIEHQTNGDQVGFPPFLAESDSEDSGTTRRAKKSKLVGSMKLLEEIARLDRWVPLPTDVMRYNLSNELCYHYCLGMLADRDFESDFWFFTRLRSFTLYLENESRRFEFSYSGAASQVEASVEEPLVGNQEPLSFLSFFSPTRMALAAAEASAIQVCTGSKTQSEVLAGIVEKKNRICVAYGHYRWAEVNHPFDLGREVLKGIGVPLPGDSKHISVLEAELSWEEVAWEEGSVCVRGKTYPLRSMFWMPRSSSW